MPKSLCIADDILKDIIIKSLKDIFGFYPLKDDINIKDYFSYEDELSGINFKVGNNATSYELYVKVLFVNKSNSDIASFTLPYTINDIYRKGDY